MSRWSLKACMSASLTVAAFFALAARPIAAQTAQPPKPPATMGGMDHSKMDGGKAHKMEDDHASSGWKELDAYHQFMMDTWHPASGKNDLAPARAKAAAMAAQAKVLAASTAPKGCDTPTLKAAVTKLAPETAALADMVTAKADDAALKNALKLLHTHFEVVEQGCKPAK